MMRALGLVVLFLIACAGVLLVYVRQHGFSARAKPSAVETFLARKVRSLLRDDGLFLNDGIARLFSDTPRRPTFISRYVFPDGELHPLAALVRSLERAGLEPRAVSSTREHYARTLRAWYRNLQNHCVAAEAEIGPGRLRVWQLYIVASAVGFDDAEISNYQVLAERSV